MEGNKPLRVVPKEVPRGLLFTDPLLPQAALLAPASLALPIFERTLISRNPETGLRTLPPRLPGPRLLLGSCSYSQDHRTYFVVVFDRIVFVPF